MNEQRDEQLWKLAKKRAGFQRSLATFFIVNAFFWAIWWFSSDHEDGGVPWPVWAMLGWGIGLAYQYLNAYGGSKEDLEKKEYEKLKNKNNP